MSAIKTLACDVDGTLVINGRLNTRLVSYLKQKKTEGFMLYLWSMQGEAHALQTATFWKVDHLFDIFISKPGYIADNEGWKWTATTHVIDRFNEPFPA